jgi:dolichol-phosphate mannosyltransferase
MTDLPQSKALVVLPTYNESGTIATVLQRILHAAGSQAEILVVDDSSPDGTAEIVRKFMENDDRVHLMVRTKKSGLGDAYIAGFRWGLERDYWAIMEMDSDLSHDPDDVPRLIDSLRNADLVIGSRYTSGGGITNWGAYRRALSKFGNLYTKAMLGHGVLDSTSGFRSYRRSVLEDQDLSTVASHGYAFQIEMTRRSHLAGHTIREVPITFHERASGVSKMSKRIVVEALWQVTKWGVADRLSWRRPETGIASGNSKS